jgi:hypothetical protein
VKDVEGFPSFSHEISVMRKNLKKAAHLAPYTPDL